VTNFLNENPAIVGLILSAYAALNLWIALFRFRQFQKFFWRHPGLEFFTGSPKSRSLHVAGSALFFAIGLAMVDSELGLFSRQFWLAAVSVAAIHFFAMSIRHLWQRKKEI
jgi:hypothetical protein